MDKGNNNNHPTSFDTTTKFLLTCTDLLQQALSVNESIQKMILAITNVIHEIETTAMHESEILERSVSYLTDNINEHILDTIDFDKHLQHLSNEMDQLETLCISESCYKDCTLFQCVHCGANVDLKDYDMYLGLCKIHTICEDNDIFNDPELWSQYFDYIDDNMINKDIGEGSPSQAPEDDIDIDMVNDDDDDDSGHSTSEYSMNDLLEDPTTTWKCIVCQKFVSTLKYDVQCHKCNDCKSFY